MEAQNDCAETYDDEADEMIKRAQQIGRLWDVRGPGTRDSESFPIGSQGRSNAPENLVRACPRGGGKTTGGQNVKDQSPCLNFRWGLILLSAIKDVCSTLKQL